MPSIPRIVSADDHVVEPGDVFTSRLPAKYRGVGPRVLRAPVAEMTFRGGKYAYAMGDEGPLADWWLFEDRAIPHTRLSACAGFAPEEVQVVPMTYDEMRPGCYDPSARLDDMDLNWVEASICFPTFPRFCGQTFLEAADKELALACVQAYNDWMIDEWCGGAGLGRLIPLTLVPLWDVELASAEVLRCAAKGSGAIAFSESPPALDLPSIHSGYWDQLWQACQDSDTTVNMHIGSSSTFPSTGVDSPAITATSLVHEGSHRALVDWLVSGVLARFPTLRIALSEGQTGWIPFVLERLDYSFENHRYGRGTLTELPSTYYRGRVFGCVIDDRTGLRMRDVVGMDQMMFEVDFPHGDSLWPDSAQALEKLAADTGLDDGELYKLARGNAIRFYRLDRLGITA